MSRGRSVALFFTLFFSLLVVEIVYIASTKSQTQELLQSKTEAVRYIGLPDLAIATDASFVRHRSISDFFSAHKDDGVLRDYFLSAVIYEEAKR